jgi:hypothetical protein
VGFLEYAWSVFLEKESLKTKLLVSPKVKSCQLYHDSQGFVAILPEPTVQETKEGEKTVSLMGYSFPATNEGKKQLLSLFRAAVLHLGFHTLFFEPHDYEDWIRGKDPHLSEFTTSIIEDTKVNAYAILRYRDKLADLAFANSLALKRMRNINRLINPATKCMAGLLVKSNTGLDWVNSKEEHDAIAHLDKLLGQFKKKASLSFTEENMDLRTEELWLADEIYEKIVDVGPVTIVPFLPHTEELGKGSVFLASYSVDSDIAREDDFKKCLEFLGGAMSTEGPQTESVKIAEAEATQVFDSWRHQKTKEEDIISKYRSFMASTEFKSVEMPEQDYTEFLRIRTRCKSEAHRLMETLLVARDALDEDPRKDYGVLDLQEIIQVIASKSPRMDVFMLDENLSKSYSWVILIDASKSMEYLKDFAMEILLILCDAANELLLDPASWGVYAFNDRFLVVKDPKERYNVRVKARIGGIRFEGSTLLSDALMTAGQVIKSRAENMRLITVISDGYSYEYSKASGTVLETVKTLEGRSISLIGIGAKSRRIGTLFKTGFSVYTLRDLSRKFSSLYLSASRVAADT